MRLEIENKDGDELCISKNSVTNNTLIMIFEEKSVCSIDVNKEQIKQIIEFLQNQL